MKKAKIASAGIFLLALLFFVFVNLWQWRKASNEAPQITSDSDVIELSVHYSQEDLLAGITAADAEDGDLTDQIIVGTPSRFITKGVSAVTYVVFDKDQNPGTYEAKIQFTDYTSPALSLDRLMVFDINEASFSNIYDSIHFTDCIEGDITDWMKVGDYDSDIFSEGVTSFPVSVSNTFGDTVSYDLQVHVVDQSAYIYNIVPVSNVIYVAQGSEFNATDYITDLVGKNTGTSYTDRISELGWDPIDTGTTGMQELHVYLYENNELVGETWIPVIVTDDATEAAEDTDAVLEEDTDTAEEEGLDE